MPMGLRSLNRAGLSRWSVGRDINRPVAMRLSTRGKTYSEKDVREISNSVAIVVQTAARSRSERHLHSFFQGIVLVRPIGGKICGKHEHAQLLESHAIQCAERRANVGTLFERTASAVNHQIRRSRQSICP